MKNKVKSDYSNVLAVVPVLNEEKTIGEVIKRFLNSGLEKKNVLVIDGGSIDKTKDIALSHGVKFVSQTGKGKGMAMIQAMTEFLTEDYQYIAFIDGDLTYMPEELAHLLDSFNNDDFGMAIGNRLSGIREKGAITPFNLLGNWIFSYIIRIFYGGELHDTQTGYRVLTRECVGTILPYLTASSFEIETEISILTLKHKIKIANIPISYHKRPDGSETKLNPIPIGFRILKTVFILKFRRMKPKM